MSIMAGIGRGAQLGVLIKNAEALERMEKIDTLVVDKTGTLTEGNPKLAMLRTFSGFGEDELLRLAASLERASEHPLAAAIIAASAERSERVSRARKALEQQFLNNCDIQLDPEDVVQNEEWKGYRLNPYLLLVKPTQLQGVGSMSQLNSSAVTTPPQPR
jgi:magnesium-transporting ATPase (P-type)